MRPLLKRAVSLLTITTTISVISLTNSASITSVGKRMFSAYNQFATTSQFYLYGRSNCTRTGWEKNVKSYEKPDILAEDYPLDLTGKVRMLTSPHLTIVVYVAVSFTPFLLIASFPFEGVHGDGSQRWDW